ncbi:MAG TPA: zf-HC2 domain-containing protein [Terriglobia bacterium]|nr:zf-HC2 domain-containing protein [Terriglobia bacterium]
MTHLEIENLASEYLEGQLDVLRRVEMERHLTACADCRGLMAEVRRAYELCHAAEDLEPAPWLVPKILRATLGERKPSLAQRLAAWFHPFLQTRVVYGVAMTVFSLSLILNVAGVSLKDVKAEDLNPRTWVYQANRNGHLLLGRVEKYYYDLKVVYEIESRLRRLRAQPGEEAPRPQAPAGGSTEGGPSDESLLASTGNSDVVPGAGGHLLGQATASYRAGRSTLP